MALKDKVVEMKDAEILREAVKGLISTFLNHPRQGFFARRLERIACADLKPSSCGNPGSAFDKVSCVHVEDTVTKECITESDTFESSPERVSSHKNFNAVVISTVMGPLDRTAISGYSRGYSRL